jgi:CRP/FNR family transcriptional regulator, cyclic AMP receptor protein
MPPAAALVARLLAETSLFGGLDTADRLAIAEQMRLNAYEPDELIFSRGDQGVDVHLVLEGRVRLSVFSIDGRVLSFKHAGRGDIFGEIAALDGGSRSADATALTNVQTLTLARHRLLRLVDTRPVVARAAIDYLCGRVRATSEQVEDIALHPISVRIARFLLSILRLSQEPRPGNGGVEIDLGMSQGDLAELLGASRQKVNEAMSALQATGALGRSKGRYACNVGELQRIAYPD